MLRQFRARHYKNLRFDVFEPGRVNVLLGPNNGGKSNLAEAVSLVWELLSAPDDAPKLQQLLSERGGPGVVARGTNPAVCRFAWDIEVETGDGVDRVHYGLNVSYFDPHDPEDAPVMDREDYAGVLRDRGEFAFHTHPEVDRWHITLRKPHGQPGSDVVLVGDDLLVLMNERPLLEHASLAAIGFAPSDPLAVQASNPARERITAVHAWVRQRLIDALGGSRRYHCSRFGSRTSAVGVPRSTPGEVLDADAERLAAVLRDRLRGPRPVPRNAPAVDARAKADLIAWLRPFLPTLRDLEVAEGGGLVWIRLQLRDEWCDLWTLSDGTVQIVTLAALLAFEDRFPILWIDEPELNLHPAWAEQLAKQIVQSRAATQLFVSTHSTEFLDAITEPVLDGSVGVFVVDAERPGPSVVPLDPDTLRAALDEGWRLGDLYRAGDPRVGGWPW